MSVLLWQVFHSAEFWNDVRWYWKNYAGRPTLLYKATKQTEDIRKSCAPGTAGTSCTQIVVVCKRVKGR